MSFRGGIIVVVGCYHWILGRFFGLRFFGFGSDWGCCGEKFLALFVHVAPPGGAGGGSGGVGPIREGYFGVL